MIPEHADEVRSGKGSARGRSNLGRAVIWADLSDDLRFVGISYNSTLRLSLTVLPNAESLEYLTSEGFTISVSNNVIRLWTTWRMITTLPVGIAYDSGGGQRKYDVTVNSLMDRYL
jgi:hypothetical protein